MQFDQVPRDRQAEAKAAVRARHAAVRLLEPIEHVRQELRRDADAGICDANLRPADRLDDGDFDASTRGRESHRVRQQVAHHLVQAIGVPYDDIRVALDAPADHQVFIGRRGLQRGERVIDDGAERHVAGRIQSQLAIGDPRQIQQFVNHARLAAGASLDGVERLRQQRLVATTVLDDRGPSP